MTAGLIVLAGLSAVVYVNQQIDINKLSQERSAVLEKLEDQKAKNQELSDIVNGENEKAYMERLAREKYGYAKTNEKVFYDISSSD